MFGFGERSNIMTLQGEGEVLLKPSEYRHMWGRGDLKNRHITFTVAEKAWFTVPLALFSVYVGGGGGGLKTLEYRHMGGLILLEKTVMIFERSLWRSVGKNAKFTCFFNDFVLIGLYYLFLEPSRKDVRTKSRKTDPSSPPLVLLFLNLPPHFW